MRSKEEFTIGQDGIDTQYERDYINYRPAITYEPPGTDASGFLPDTAGQDGLLFDELEDFDESSVIQVWEDVVEVVQQIDLIEKTLNEKLKDLTVPISASRQSDIREAAEALGHTGVTNSIPFSLYKDTFNHPSSPSAVLIQETFEDYMADVDGVLNGELYADVAELQKDWDMMLDFVNKGLMAQLVPMDKVPTDVSVEDNSLALIEEKEKAMNTEYLQLSKLKNVNRHIYLELAEKEYGSERYFQAVKEYDESKRNLLYLEKKLFTRTETVDLIERKASDTTDTLGLIESAIDFDPYAEGRYEMIYGLLKQYGGKESAQNGLRKVQALLKLSVDGKKITTDSHKSTLRGMTGIQTKAQVNQTLVNGIHLRNEVFTDVLDMIQNLDGVPANENVEIMLNHIADGVEQAEQFYQMQASDFYKVHVMDTELRKEKLKNLIDKDTARSTYKLMGEMTGYLKDTKSTWPTDEKMSAWLHDFMEQSKLS